MEWVIGVPAAERSSQDRLRPFFSPGECVHHMLEVAYRGVVMFCYVLPLTLHNLLYSELIKKI